MTTEKTAHPHALGLFAGLAIFFFFFGGARAACVCHEQMAKVPTRSDAEKVPEKKRK